MVNGKEKVSTSLDIFSTVLTTLVEITVFITGCFQCSKNSDYYHKDDRDRAWFDDQTIQTEEPYCYVNPAATHTVKPKGQYNSDKIPNGKNASSNGVVKFHSSKPIRKVENSVKVAPLSTKISETKSTEVAKFNKPYQSFAVNVEEEYLDSKKNSLRSEGDTPQKKKAPSEVIPKRGKMRSPVAHRRIWHQLSADNNAIDWDSVSFDSSIDDDISLDDYKLFDDIWRSCELENAFVDYNMATFNNPGCNTANQNSASKKSAGEKFDDIFPSRKFLEAKISENVDSVSSFDSESDFSLTKTSTCSNFSVLRFSSNVIELDELSELIDLCICSNTKENLECNISKHLRHFCDSDFTINGKTYGTILLYDLVRQIMLENYVEYPSSSNLSRLIPLNNVKKKVLRVMKLRDKEDPRTVHETNFNRSAIDAEKLPDSIDRIINEEIKSETKHWQSFDLESKAMRESVYKEIFRDLVDSVTTEVSLVWSKKLSSLKL